MVVPVLDPGHVPVTEAVNNLFGFVWEVCVRVVRLPAPQSPGGTYTNQPTTLITNQILVRYHPEPIKNGPHAPRGSRP